ncbi:MAG: DUF4190 domain-containing protein [Chloroflexi bacterium]|nr:MAG: DUF4190 domain-containing protein [Chloroflexota bacterium]
MAILGSRKLGTVSDLPPPPSSGAPTRIAGQESVPTSVVPQGPAYVPSRSSYNSMAVVSIITGAFSVFGHIVIPGIGGGSLAVIAIVTGFIGRREIRRTGEQGMWMATLGMVLGIAHLAIIALVFILFIVVVFFLGGLALLHR